LILETIIEFKTFFSILL